MALVDIDGNLSVVMTGILLMTHRVEEIDVEGGCVILREQNQPSLVLTASGNNTIPWPELPQDYVQFLMTTEGLRQMNAIRGIPTERAANWSKVSRDEQVETLFGYLRQGLVVGIVFSDSQASTGFFGKLFEKQIAAEVPAKKEAFLASLTAEQRELHETRMTLVRFTDPPEIKDRQIADNLALGARQKEMLAGLTPQQRALYEEYQLWHRP